MTTSRSRPRKGRKKKSNESKTLHLLVTEILEERRWLREQLTDTRMNYDRECRRRDEIIYSQQTEIGRLMEKLDWAESQGKGKAR